MENIAVLRRIFTVFGIALLVTGLLIYFYRVSFDKFSENSEMLVYNLAVQEKLEELIGIIKDTESGTRGFVVTDDSTFLKPFLEAKSSVHGKLDELRVLFKDNPTQAEYLDSISNVITRKIAVQDFIVHLKETDNFKFGYLELMKESSSYMDTIRTFTAKMKAEQDRMRILHLEEVKDSIIYTRVLSTIFSVTAISIMIVSLLSILWEIRSKKKVRELLKTVLESSQSGIMSFRASRDYRDKITDFSIIQANKIAASMLKIASIDLIGKSFLSLFPNTLQDGLFTAYVDVTEHDKIFRTERHYKQDASDLWLRIVAVKLEDGFTVTFDDITKEKRYESELQQSILDLKRSNSELEQFAFVASHDLQEPLRKIQSFGERLRIYSADKLNDNSKTYIDKMLSASKRMSTLINDLLEFSRLARISEAVVKVNLQAVLTDVKNDLELTIQHKQAKLISGDLPSIEGIPSQIYQLFFNIIGNALKFSREGVPPVIVIKTETIQSNIFNSGKPDSFVRITISDNGIGFENQYSTRIFEIFQRLHGKSEFEGTGIGLAICKRIVTNHRGIISAKGDPGKGAEFTFELPVTQRP